MAEYRIAVIVDLTCDSEEEAEKVYGAMVDVAEKAGAYEQDLHGENVQDITRG